ncbi:MAG: hypothetical protein QOF78_2294 [Phycisphaerales bacterium]|nr:hypothetical protein [Phycisphaerales bacterium]
MDANQTQKILDAAIAHHSAGRLAEAEPLYRQILEKNPDDPRALHLLGVMSSQRGDKEQAVILIARAIEKNPGAAEYHSNLGLVFLEQGRPEPAVLSCRRSIELNPRDAEAHFILANALRELGRGEESMQKYRRVLELNPQHTSAMRNFGRLLTALGRSDEALQIFRKLLSIRPDWPDALLDYGELLRTTKNFPEALAAYDRAIAIQPDFALAHNARGLVLHEAGPATGGTGGTAGTDTTAAAAAAESAYRRGLEFDPDNAGIRNNLGYALELQGKFAEALQQLERAVALRPDMVDAIGNLANTFRDLGRWSDADAAYVRALRLQPDSHRARFNRALLLLLLGRFEEGWTEYEWRWLLFPQHKRTFLQPRWLDADIRGKTILLYAEQGFGDTIQFARYATRVAAERGATVILECHAELFPLLRNVEGISQCIPRAGADRAGEALPAFDVQAPLLSLPLSFQTFSVDSIPRTAAYLHADPAKVQHWRQRLAAAPVPPVPAPAHSVAAPDTNTKPKMRIGLAWAGDPTHKLDLLRSCALKDFAPLADLENLVFYSLQKGPRSARPSDVPPNMRFVDFSADLHDFSDTAALMMNLDLIISVDTAIVHLAGALGRPVFTLLPFNPDFRWLLDRDDSPWYPTMKLFRPTKPLDWATVFANVKSEIEKLLARA